MEITKREIKNWMKREVKVYVDPDTLEVDCTTMAEECAWSFNSPRWLDNETHDVWDAAVEVAEWYEKSL